MNIGLCSWVVPGDNLESFKIAQKVGAKGVVLDFTLDGPEAFTKKENRDKYLKMVSITGVTIPTMSVNIFCERGMTSKKNFEFAKEVFQKAIEAAVYMKVDKLQIPCFYDGLILTDEDLKNTINCIKYACKLGRENNVRIGVEHVMTLKHFDKFKEEVLKDHDDNKAILAGLFDSQNPWRMLNQDGLRIAKYLALDTQELHAKDSIPGRSFVALGSGDVMLKESFKVFKDMGYDEWIMLESNYSNAEDYIAALKEDIDILNTMWAK